MKKRILFTLVNLKTGGVEKALISMLKNIDYDLYDVDLMLLEKSGELIKNVPKNVKILCLKDFINLNTISNSTLYRFKKNLLVDIIIKQYNKLKNLKYDIAISFNGFNNYSDLITAVVQAKKRIIWVHNDFYSMITSSRFPFLYKWMYKAMGRKFKYFDIIVSVSENIRKTFDALYGFAYTDKIFVLPNIVDSDEIKSLSTVPGKVKLSNKFNLISIGRLCKAKNYESLISLHKKLRMKGYDINTYLIGDGELYENLKCLVIENKIEDSFFLLGLHINPYNILKQASLYVSTSLYESYGITVLESLVLGIPVISTNTQGAKDIKNTLIKDESLTIAKDNSELYDLVEKAIKNKKKFQPLDMNDKNKKIMNQFYQLIS